MQRSQFRENIKYFSIEEFPEWIGFAEDRLFFKLDKFREILNCPIYPSPAEGALARFTDKTSMHYCEKKGPIKSQAVDVFCGCRSELAFFQALASQLWGGIGIYFDTHFHNKFWPLLHLDMRGLGQNHSKETTLIWFRDEKYIYPQYSEKDFQRLLTMLRKVSDQSATSVGRK